MLKMICCLSGTNFCQNWDETEPGRTRCAETSLTETELEYPGFEGVAAGVEAEALELEVRRHQRIPLFKSRGSVGSDLSEEALSQSVRVKVPLRMAELEMLGLDDMMCVHF